MIFHVGKADPLSQIGVVEGHPCQFLRFHFRIALNHKFICLRNDLPTSRLQCYMNNLNSAFLLITLGSILLFEHIFVEDPHSRRLSCRSRKKKPPLWLPRRA